MEKKKRVGRKVSLHRKLLLSIIVVAAVISIASCLVGYIRYNTTLRELYNDNGYVIGQIILDHIDHERIARYAETWEEDEYYPELEDYLTRVQEASGAKYIYIAIPDGRTEDGTGTMRYIYDCTGCKIGDVDPVSKYYEEMEYTYQTGNVSDNRFERKSQKYGWLTSCILPINDSSGKPTAILFVDIAMELIVSTLISYIVTVVVISAVLVAFFCLAYWKFMQRSFIRPIEFIRKNSREFIENGVQVNDALDQIQTGDELQELAESIGSMEHSIVDYIDNIKTITAEKERIGAELNVATQIQASMLPCIFPPFPEHDEFDIFASMNPAKEVGGDFYDFYLVDETHLALTIADVSGKGVPAALFMVIAKSLLKSSAQSGLSPKKVFESINAQLCENNEVGMFVTVWMGILDLTNGKMVCCNAGHELPAIRRKNGQFEFFKDPHGFVMAGMEMSRYREYELQFEPGDRLFVYTDGVPEATDANNELFGNERMLAALNSHPKDSCTDLLKHIKQDVDAFVGEAPQFDDLTMLSIEVKKFMEK